MPQPYVLFDNVCKYYQMGDTRIAASDHVSFEIQKGEFCVILGPSGAGKTTVLNMLGGMDTCDEGTILLDGEKVSGFDKKRLTTYRRYDVGFVFQFYNLVQNLTARENVELAAEICRDPLDADTVLDEVGLADRKNNFPAQLSGGPVKDDGHVVVVPGRAKGGPQGLGQGPEGGGGRLQLPLDQALSAQASGAG